jgi:hypothetical protein
MALKTSVYVSIKAIKIKGNEQERDKEIPSELFSLAHVACELLSLLIQEFATGTSCQHVSQF